MDSVSLDVHSKDFLGLLARFFSGASELHSAGLSASADLDLRLDDKEVIFTKQLLCSFESLVWRACNDSREHGDAVSSEQLPCLVFVEIHCVPSLCARGAFVRAATLSRATVLSLQCLRSFPWGPSATTGVF